MQYKGCGNVPYSSGGLPLYNTAPVEGSSAFISVLDVNPNWNIVRSSV
jgi:hypothetical protein